MAEIEFLKVRGCSMPGTVKGYCSVRLGGVTIHDCKIVQQNGQRRWLAMPDRSYESGGKKRYSPYVELSPAIKDRLSEMVQVVVIP